MWLFTPKGFYSVVQLRDNSERLMIRSRSRQDLINLRNDHIPDLEIIETKHTDYRYRAIVPRRLWLNTLVELGDEIDYGNFKAEVKARQGKKRARVYEEVWSTLLQLQPFSLGSRFRRRSHFAHVDEAPLFEDLGGIDEITGQLPSFE